MHVGLTVVMSSGGNTVKPPTRKGCPGIDGKDSRKRLRMTCVDRFGNAKFLHFHKPSTRKVSDPTFHVAEVRLKHC